NHFPADFIVEGIDQTRGWFYSLHVLGTALHGKPAYKHCLATGLLMAEAGVKLSKKLKNYPDPYVVLDNVGSDTLRWFLVSSPAVRAGQAYVNEKEIIKTTRKAVLPFWNAYYFFCLYANAEGIKAQEITTATDVLDRYILGKLKALTISVKEQMNAYDMARACNDCSEFLDILNNWYVRRSRARFWDGTDTGAFNTLYTVLVTLSKIMAPMMPMMAEFVYRGLTGGESVHLCDYPTVDALADEHELIGQMDLVRQISSTAKSIREEYKLRNRLPLKTMTVAGSNAGTLTNFADVLKDEVNVKDIVLSTDIASVADTFLYLKTPLIGKRLGRFMKDIMAASKGTDWKVLEDGTLSIAGQILTTEEFELRLVLKDGLNGQALPDNTAVVQLDTTLYPDLEKEGIARDFVRMIQQARKEADFDVSDRITVIYTVNTPLLVEAIKEHSDYIADQVLAVAMRAEETAVSGAKTEELGDGQVAFVVER
ncbi:MAG: class I tRNA ligase family protein, partial [Alphaproteobacteria bacterium]|nr:class I tRNA ligase family protein [Alphaproteobacteria bacterium]